MALRVEPVVSLRDARADWTGLAAASRNVFATWEFAEAWWRQFGGGRRLATYIFRRGNETIGVLPLYAWRERPLRVLRFIGAPEADELGPIGHRSAADEIRDALGRILDETAVDILVAEHLPQELGWHRLPRARTLRAEATPVLRLERLDWETYLAGRSANFRSVVRRSERKLAKRGGRFRLSREETLEADLDALFRLHAARWNGQTPFAERVQFQRAFARIASEQGWLRLWILEVDENAIAAWHGFRFEGVESYYQAGRDPAWDEYRLGLVLLAHSVRSAMEDGMAEYRFLRGDEPYKRRFTDLDPGLESVAVGHTRSGAAAVAAGAWALAARRRGRAVARRVR